ncbi:MAG TPA: ATP-binding protein [Gammaproteobacteria bacterium]|nr:ATP-binding protein [Gammaproteobacteria bacterium]
MSLRVQLLALGLFTLALPWAGYRYVQVLENALRDGLEQALLASAETVAVAMRDTPLGIEAGSEPRIPANTVYAHALAAAPALDGYRNDWTLPERSEQALGASASYWIGVYDRSVYVFLEVADDELIYQSAPTELPYGDRALVLPRGADDDWLLLHALAPGLLRPQWTARPAFAPTAQYEDRALAYWRETRVGYALEMRLPLDLAGGKLGLAVIDVDPRSGPGPATTGDYAVTMQGSWPFDAQPPPPLIHPPAALGLQSQRFVLPGRRMRIVDADGWVLFDAGAIDPLDAAFDTAPASLAEQLLRLILARGEAPYTDLEDPPGYLAQPTLRPPALRGGAVEWYARGGEASAVVVAAAAITGAGGVRGAVVLEQGSDAILTLTNEALVDLISFTLIASLLVAAGLLSYATYLSIRIGRLARAADTAMGPKGDIDPKLPGREASDEIGDLARSFTALLRRLRDHTRYLTTLKGKLAHELRTPLAVVATSIENLEREPRGGDITPYLTRLREGADRLDAILVAMSEATALEQAVSSTSRERFELDAVVRGCVEGYRDVYADRRFDFTSEIRAAVLGSADLVAQMLDKLIDNAVSFSAPGSVIAVAITASDRELRLAVSNAGPPLPAAMRASIFDSLVSVRDRASHRGHLGLGLYIVALIAEFHGGSASADDLPDGRGVVFTVAFPRAPARH